MGFRVAQMTTRQELRAIQEALDKRNITNDPFCGVGDIACRVEWVLRRNEILEARCKEWAEKYNFMEADRNSLLRRSPNTPVRDGEDRASHSP